MSRMLPDMYVANVKPLSSAGSATPSISILLRANMSFMVGMCSWLLTSLVDRSISPYLSLTTDAI